MIVVNRARDLMRRILSRLRGPGFVKNVMFVMTGTVAAQAVGFAVSPIISRLFTPFDFGVFGSFSAVLGVISTGVTLEFSSAIMLPKENKDAAGVFVLSCISTILITTCCLVACLFAASQVRNLIQAPSSIFVALLVVAILIGGLQSSVQSWSVRAKAFKEMSASQVIRSLSSNGSQVGLGFIRTGAIGMVLSTVLGDFLAMLSLLRVVLPDLLAFRHSIRWQEIKELAREYRNFPIYSAPREVINALSRGLPVLLLSNYFGVAVAGAYAFGLRILNAPLYFVQSAMKTVLFQKATEIYNRGSGLMLLYVKMTGGLFLLALVPSAIFLLWAPQIFAWVFGSQWNTAGEYARWLVLWQAIGLCNLPSIIFAQVVRMQRQAFFFDIALTVVRTLSLVFGGLFLSALHTVVVFSVASSGMNMVWICIVGARLMNKEGGTNWRRMLSAANLWK